MDKDEVQRLDEGLRSSQPSRLSSRPSAASSSPSRLSSSPMSLGSSPKDELFGSPSKDELLGSSPKDELDSKLSPTHIIPTKFSPRPGLRSPDRLYDSPEEVLLEGAFRVWFRSQDAVYLVTLTTKNITLQEVGQKSGKKCDTWGFRVCNENNNCGVICILNPKFCPQGVSEAPR